MPLVLHLNSKVNRERARQWLLKAPDDVVAENRRRLEDEQLKLDGLRAALSRLN